MIIAFFLIVSSLASSRQVAYNYEIDQGCRLNAMELSGSHLDCVKHHRTVQSLIKNLRSGLQNTFGNSHFKDLFRKDFLVLSVCSEEPHKFYIVLLFRNNPKIYFIDLDEIDRCNFKVTKIYADEPSETVKNRMDDLQQDSGFFSYWQNVSSVDPTDDACGPQIG